MPIKPSTLRNKILPTLIARLKEEGPLSLSQQALIAQMTQTFDLLDDKTGEAPTPAVIDEVLYAGKKKPQPQSVNANFQAFKANINALFAQGGAHITCRSRKAKAPEQSNCLFFEKTDARFFKRDYRKPRSHHVLSGDEIVKAFAYGLLRRRPKMTANLKAVARYLFTIAAIVDATGMTTAGAFSQNYIAAETPQRGKKDYLFVNHPRLIASFFSVARLDVRLVVDPTSQAKGDRPLCLFGDLPKDAPHPLVAQAVKPATPLEALQAARRFLRLYEESKASL